MLEVRHLRLVRAIADEGGATRAAARLHLTQSAVSHQLAELESRLGVPLFTRVRRKLELTPAGTRLVEASRDLLGDLTRLERELQETGRKKREVLRVAVESFTTYRWLVPVAAALGDEIEPRIVLAAAREPVSALLRGALDLALVSSAVRDRDLVSTPLFDDEWTVIVAPGHPFAARRFVTAVELGGETVFAHDAPRSDVERMRELVAAERARMPRVVIVPLTDALVEMVAANLGVGLVSSWAVAPALARREVVARRLTKAGLSERWSAVYRRDAEDRLPMARIVELLRHLPR